MSCTIISCTATYTVCISSKYSLFPDLVDTTTSTPTSTTTPNTTIITTIR